MNPTTNVTIGGETYETITFSVSEQATPLAAGDSSGSVGTVNMSITAPDPDLQPTHILNTIGPEYLSKKSFSLNHADYGFVSGTVTQVGYSEESATIQLSGTTDLGPLNVYNVQSQPYNGTLGGAFSYYCSLAGLSGSTDPAIASTPVTFPGWNGELWFNMKQMAASVDAEIAAVQGVVRLRPIRQTGLLPYTDTARTSDVNADTLAQFVEVYAYQNRWVTDTLVYPPGGWSSDVAILSVSAGEYVEQTIQLSTSVQSIQAPTMVTDVPRDYQSSSRYTVVGDDGFPVLPAQWADSGGSIQVTINPDTVSLTVAMQGPTTDIIMSNGEPSKTFSLALAADTSGSRYSTLRIVGTGTQFDKQKVMLPTGVSASETGTEIGVTIDNPFLSTWDQLYRAGTRAAKAFSGFYPSVTVGSVAPLDPLQGYTFGNIAGSRVVVRDRPFRVREATITPENVSVTGDDDLTNGDVQAVLSGRTYGWVQTANAGLTYREVQLRGRRY